jgi:hypothetical protein
MLGREEEQSALEINALTEIMNGIKTMNMTESRWSMDSE